MIQKFSHNIIFVFDKNQNLNESKILGISITQEITLDSFVNVLDCPFQTKHETVTASTDKIWVEPNFDRKSKTIEWIRIGQLFVFDGFSASSLAELTGICKILAQKNKLTPIMETIQIANVKTDGLQEYADKVTSRLNKRLLCENNLDFFKLMYKQLVV